MRLSLEPVSPANAEDLYLIHADDAVWPWYAPTKPTRAQMFEAATRMSDGWRLHGVHKWIAYDRETGEPVGRGGLSRTPIDDDWGQLYAFLPSSPWTREPYKVDVPFIAHANWLELGWAVRGKFQGRGYATEIGQAGLTYAFNTLGAQAVVSCTARHNTASRAVMARIGMHHAGEIKTRGMVEGSPQEHPDAPYAVSVLLRSERPDAGE